jgi:hypothetical protein
LQITEFEYLVLNWITGCVFEVMYFLLDLFFWATCICFLNRILAQSLPAEIAAGCMLVFLNNSAWKTLTAYIACSVKWQVGFLIVVRNRDF